MENVTIGKVLDYNSVTHITQNPLIIGIIAGIWLITLILYLIIAGSIRAKTSSGTKLKGSLLSKPTGWIPVFIWLIQAGLTLIFLIIPVWLSKSPI
jgi:hypothetical protein